MRCTGSFALLYEGFVFLISWSRVIYPEVGWSAVCVW
jgi:hypothetical protein